MSDEQELSNAIEGGDDGFGNSGGHGDGFGKLIVKILAWAAAAILAVILIVTIVIITVRLMDKQDRSQSFVEVSQEYEGQTPVYSYFDGIPQIRGNTIDVNPQMYVVTISLGYEMNNNILMTELSQRSNQLVDIVRKFFSQKTALELTAPYEDQLKQELKEKINRILMDGKIKEVLVMELNTF